MNPPGLGQKRVRLRSPIMCFWHRLFSFFEHLFGTFAIEVNSNNISKHKKQWKRIRTTILARTVVSCLRSAHARRRRWEPPYTTIFPNFDVRASLFFKLRSEPFTEKSCQMDPPEWHPRSKKIWQKSTLQTQSTKHVKNVLKLMPSDLRTTNFRMERLQRSHKPEARTSVNKY